MLKRPEDMNENEFECWVLDIVETTVPESEDERIKSTELK